jgi:CDP-diacylglycerol--glycerol-3-phosphate 3-phosphatidyltransferase
MWLLAVTSLITLGQRVHSVRTSPGAMDRLVKPENTGGETPEAPAAQGDES